MNRKIPFFLIFLFIFFANTAYGFIYYEPAYGGKVIDADTKEPIEGVTVSVDYSKSVFGFADSHTVDYDKRETLTDKNGEFYIPAYIAINLNPLTWFGGRSHEAIGKTGYYEVLRVCPINKKVAFGKEREKPIVEEVIRDDKKIQRITKYEKLGEGEGIAYRKSKNAEKITQGEYRKYREYRVEEYHAGFIPLSNPVERLKNLDIPFELFDTDINLLVFSKEDFCRSYKLIGIKKILP